jgi:hypothetical protein
MELEAQSIVGMPMHQKMTHHASIREGFRFYSIVAVGRLNRICSVGAAGKIVSHGYLHVGIPLSVDEHI